MIVLVIRGYSGWLEKVDCLVPVSYVIIHVRTSLHERVKKLKAISRVQDCKNRRPVGIYSTVTHRNWDTTRRSRKATGVSAINGIVGVVVRVVHYVDRGFLNHLPVDVGFRMRGV